MDWRLRFDVIESVDLVSKKVRGCLRKRLGRGLFC